MGCSNSTEKQHSTEEYKEEVNSEIISNEQNEEQKSIPSNVSNLSNNNTNNVNHIPSSPNEQQDAVNEDSLASESVKSEIKSNLSIKSNENNFDISFDFEKGHYGIIFSPNVTQIHQPNLTENSLRKMITDSIKIAKEKNDINIKQLTQKQINIISSIIYKSITLNNTENSDNISQLKPIHHPLLENVLIKVCLRDLALDILKETCFKDKQIKPKDIKQALNDIQTGTIRNQSIKVLSIEVL